MPPRSLRFSPEKIAQLIKEARERRHMTQAALAEKVDMEEDTYRHKENGKNPFYLDELSIICDVLQTPSLFPFLDWDAALMVDRTLGRPPVPP